MNNFYMAEISLEDPDKACAELDRISAELATHDKEHLIDEVARLRAELAVEQNGMRLLDELYQAARKDAERYRWALPILTAQGNEGDRRAMQLALQLVAGLDGDEAIDAALNKEEGGR